MRLVLGGGGFATIDGLRFRIVSGLVTINFVGFIS
jgi:hypothetical protein